jgi:hypothetical protein
MRRMGAAQQRWKSLEEQDMGSCGIAGEPAGMAGNGVRECGGGQDPAMAPWGEFPGTPCMTDAETACFRRWIPYGGTALEFGCGGSTKCFFTSGIRTLHTVDSDPNYLRKAMDDPFLSFFIKKKRLSLYYADIGPVAAWGNPTSAPMVSWLSYHSGVWEQIDGATIDFVLVDGRFRVSCVLQTILHCDKNVKLFVHDFLNRPQYVAVLEFTEVIDVADNAVVLSRKRRVNYKKLAVMLQKMQFNFE